MTSGLTSLIFTLGFSCWLYTKLLNRTGGNTETCLKATGGVALVMFLLVYSLLRFVLGF